MLKRQKTYFDIEVSRKFLVTQLSESPKGYNHDLWVSREYRFQQGIWRRSPKGYNCNYGKIIHGRDYLLWKNVITIYLSITSQVALGEFTDSLIQWSYFKIFSFSLIWNKNLDGVTYQLTGSKTPLNMWLFEICEYCFYNLKWMKNQKRKRTRKKTKTINYI